MASDKYEINMVDGALFPKILIFYFPLMISGVLQLLFNAADIVVVGRFAGAESLAAVGSTSSLTNLLVNFFIGISIGTNVITASLYGGKRDKELKEIVHTSIATALISGFILLLMGLLLAKPALILMGTPKDVIDKSVLYMRVYFIGMPVSMLYNFGAAILRAVGDTRRPMYYLLFAGLINVILNIIFVVSFNMDVAGVAAATVISQAVSAILVIRCLMKTEGAYRFIPKELSINKEKLIKMLRIGLPAGLQSSLFSISNVLIQSSVNSFGSVAMAGNTAASNIEGFVYISMNSLYQTAVSFTGQNYGAKKMDRVLKISIICELMVIIVGLVLGNLAYIGGPFLLSIYSSDQNVISYGLLRLSVICTFYCLCGMMDVMVGVLRGMGHSVMPMIVSLTGACLFRVIWIFTIFRSVRTLFCLYISYPISWALTFSVHLICFIVIYRNILTGKKDNYPLPD